MIQKEIEKALGCLILKGEVKDGDTVLVVKDPLSDRLRFTAQVLLEQKGPEQVSAAPKATAA